MLRAGFLLLMVGCVSMGSTPPKTVDQVGADRRAETRGRKREGPSALTEAPGEGERPELIDSSLAIELDNGRGAPRFVSAWRLRCMGCLPSMMRSACA